MANSELLKALQNLGISPEEVGLNVTPTANPFIAVAAPVIEEKPLVKAEVDYIEKSQFNEDTLLKALGVEKDEFNKIRNLASSFDTIVKAQRTALDQYRDKLTKAEFEYSSLKEKVDFLEKGYKELQNTPIPLKSLTNIGALERKFSSPTDDLTKGMEEGGTLLSLSKHRKQISNWLQTKALDHLQKGENEIGREFTGAVVNFETQQMLAPAIIKRMNQENVFIVE